MSQWDILTGDVERDRRNVTVLMESVAELYGPRPLADLLRGAVDRAILVTGAQRGILLVQEEGRLAPRVARDLKGRDLPLDLRYSHSVVDKVFETGVAHQTVDAENPAAASLGQSVLELRLLSIMAVPLTVKQERIGLLYVDSTVQAKEFTRADFAVLNALGGMVALAIENGRLLEERVEKERLEREMSIARDIQQRLFPKDIVPPPGFDLAGVGRPCEETSGDYYDVIPLEGGRIALVVGDVSGHGLGSAMYMAATRALLHATLAEGEDPTRALATLNGFLCRDMPEETFVSLFLGIFDPAARTLVYASAGHNPPVVQRQDGAREELGCTGPVLGILPQARWRLAPEVELGAGDVVFLYTDGIYEAHGEDGEMWGEERFQDSLGRHVKGTRSAEDLIGAVLQDLESFRGTRPLDDDITCLALRSVATA